MFSSFKVHRLLSISKSLEVNFGVQQAPSPEQQIQLQLYVVATQDGLSKTSKRSSSFFHFIIYLFRVQCLVENPGNLFKTGER